ncbi:MAG: hypothetical protein H6739_10990 [Alphaproteobacteria bacterium]|nr:hypothetical protein [Alphaproteobacteria bacterium]
MKRHDLAASHAIWVFAALYFACYVPYSGLTKALSKGLHPDAPVGVAGATLLPVATATSLVVMLLFLTAMGWWRFATHREVLGVSLPVPTRWTGLSGLCTAAILTTTTLAYTFDGVSIVFVMLLMRGGVLILAPVVDALTGRRTRWFSWVGLGLSFAALLVAFAEQGGYALTLACGVDIAVYLLAYLVRLRFMSRLAKSEDTDVTRRYFVEEQLVAVPSTMVLLVLAAIWGQGEAMAQVREGFTTFLDSGLVAEAALIGAFSQGTGIFGTLVFLDKRENTFSVPVNRSASILAGVVASLLLALLFEEPLPSLHQLGGAGLVIAAVVALSLGPMAQARWKAAAAG